ncbi:hypothetical protein Pfo_019334 [Paulownia fortunei]|nr:hypothetical protein Pfo_019334 [Paulownia fortunei]
MESYYSYTSNSASSSSANSSTQFPYHYQQEIKRGKPPPAFRSALHSVRKIPAKNIITKKPIAPLPPTPPKVYKVDPVDFKDVVQKLTGAPEFLPTRLQEVAPPPLSLSPPHRPTALFHPPVKKPLLGNLGAAFMAEDEEQKARKSFDSSFGALSPLGFTLSPSSLAWCSAILLSPGTLASLEPNAVL